MSRYAISDKAVESAAKVLAVPGFEFEFYLKEAREALEAAAPYMLGISDRNRIADILKEVGIPAGESYHAADALIAALGGSGTSEETRTVN